MAAARVAAGTERSAPALAMLGWPEWEKYCEHTRARLVQRTQRTKTPATLHAWLPGIGPPARHALQGRPHIPHVSLDVGDQWFTRWAALTLDSANERDERTPRIAERNQHVTKRAMRN